MEATFENTVDILVKAYLNDTLIHANCTACAVGNIIRGSGYPLPFRKKDEKGDWNWLGFVRQRCRGEANEPYIDYKDGMNAILSTGYSVRSIDSIEKAFESTYWHDDPVFDGLMAVVSVLADIHGVDLETTEKAKLLFVKP